MVTIWCLTEPNIFSVLYLVSNYKQLQDFEFNLYESRDYKILSLR